MHSPGVQTQSGDGKSRVPATDVRVPPQIAPAADHCEQNRQQRRRHLVLMILAMLIIGPPVPLRA